MTIQIWIKINASNIFSIFVFYVPCEFLFQKQPPANSLISSALRIFGLPLLAFCVWEIQPSMYLGHLFSSCLWKYPAQSHLSCFTFMQTLTVFENYSSHWALCNCKFFNLLCQWPCLTDKSSQELRKTTFHHFFSIYYDSHICLLNFFQFQLQIFLDIYQEWRCTNSSRYTKIVNKCSMLNFETTKQKINKIFWFSSYGNFVMVVMNLVFELIEIFYVLVYVWIIDYFHPKKLQSNY